MISFPTAKINLGLYIVERRNDGYHNLETVFYPVGIRDALEIIPAPHLSTPEITVTGLPVAGGMNENLCIKAWHLLKKTFPSISAVQMHLHKLIPMGAGLGGGSSNGAAALVIMNDIFGCSLNKQELADYALQLGSDCPFFIYNTPVIAGGRGEIMEPLELDLNDYSIIIINPGLHISTAQAFTGIRPQLPKHPLKLSILRPPEEWKEILYNDFEQQAFTIHPDLKDLKDWLYQSGAMYAAMSGSGSSFYGIFPKHQAPVSAPSASWKIFPVQ